MPKLMSHVYTMHGAKEKKRGELRETGDTCEAMLPKQKRPPRCTGILFFCEDEAKRKTHPCEAHTYLKCLSHCFFVGRRLSFK